MSLTIDDLNKIEKTLEPRFQGIESRFEEIRLEFRTVNGRIDRLTQSVDEFVRMARRYDEEWLVVRAQHEKIRNVLIKKGIATEDELSVTS